MILEKINKQLLYIFIGILISQVSCLETETKSIAKERKFDFETNTIDEFRIGIYEFEVEKIIRRDLKTGEITTEFDTVLVNLEDFYEDLCEDYCDFLFEKRRKEHLESLY